MHVNIKDIAGREIAPGVVERTLLDALETHLGVLTVSHYVLSEGGRMEYGASLTE